MTSVDEIGSHMGMLYPYKTSSTYILISLYSLYFAPYASESQFLPYIFVWKPYIVGMHYTPSHFSA